MPFNLEKGFLLKDFCQIELDRVHNLLDKLKLNLKNEFEKAIKNK